MIDDLTEWIGDHKIGCAVIAILMVLIIISGVIAYATANIQDNSPPITPTPIVNASTPTPIVNASTPTPTVKPTITPTTTNNESYNRYMDDLMALYGVNKTELTTNPVFIDPLSYEAYNAWNKTKTNTSKIKPFDGTSYGVSVYGSPTPTPTPTPKPDDPFTREVHYMQSDQEYLPDWSKYDSTNNGPVTIADTRGIYEYYHNDPYKSDYVILQMKLLSTYWKPIVNPTIQLEFLKPYTNASTGQIDFITAYSVNHTWQTTIPAASWDYDMKYLTQPAPKATYTLELGHLDQSYPKGTYVIRMSMYYDGIRMCQLNHAVTLF